MVSSKTHTHTDTRREQQNKQKKRKTWWMLLLLPLEKKKQTEREATKAKQRSRGERENKGELAGEKLTSRSHSRGCMNVLADGDGWTVVLFVPLSPSLSLSVMPPHT